MLRLIRLALIGVGISFAASAQAQITEPRTLSATPVRKATLEEQLINRLRATKDDQKAYIRFVVKKVEEEELEKRLVLAVERYSIRRNRYFPFPFFERAIRFEAAKRSVLLPSVQTFATTRSRTR